MAVSSVVGLPSGIQDSFDKEATKGFKLGFKSTLANGDLILNAAAFSTHIDNACSVFFVGTNAVQTIRNISDSVIEGSKSMRPGRHVSLLSEILSFRCGTTVHSRSQCRMMG